MDLTAIQGAVAGQAARVTPDLDDIEATSLRTSTTGPTAT